METERKLAVIIATRNRPDLIPDLMKSIDGQTITPKKVVIVDSSDEEMTLNTSVLQDLREMVQPIEITYFTSDRKSLPAQRNIGIDSLDISAFEFVLFLDDDVRPEPGYAEKLISTLDADSSSVGCSGVTGPPPPRIHGFKRISRIMFLLYSEKGGVVLKSGFNFPIRDHAQGPVKTEWIFGCSLWKTQVFKQLRYPEQLPGGALYEDAIFSVSAGKYGDLWVNPDAYLLHLLSNDGRPDSELDGIRKVRNRYELIKILEPRGLSILAFFWSWIGQAILLIRHALPWYLGNGQPGNKVVADQLKGHVKGILLVLFNRRPI